MEINKEHFLALLTEIFQPFLSDHNISSFPGNLPISLQRQHLFQLIFGYLASLKADGERCFIFICCAKIFTINRNLDINYIGKLKTNDNYLYLFDAEVIYENKLILLFDTLIFKSLKKHSILRSDITQRNELTRFFVFTNGFEIFEESCFTTTRFPSSYPNSEIKIDNLWRIQTKPIFLYHHLNQIWNNRNKLEYICDGIVFSRQWAAYQPYTNDPMSLIKWKPITTLDFYVCNSIDEFLVFIPSQFSEFQSKKGQYALLTNIEPREIFTYVENLDLKYLDLIVEFYWEKNKWIPLKIRTDKKQPNKLKTVLDTLKNIQDPIQIQDFYS